MFIFRRIWRALFSWNTRFEIRQNQALPNLWSRTFILYFTSVVTYLRHRTKETKSFIKTVFFFLTKRNLNVFISRCFKQNGVFEKTLSFVNWQLKFSVRKKSTTKFDQINTIYQLKTIFEIDVPPSEKFLGKF